MSKVISREEFHYYLEKIKETMEFEHSAYKIGVDLINAPDCVDALVRLLTSVFDGNQSVSYFCFECDNKYPFDYWTEEDEHIIVRNEDELYERLIKEMHDENE